MRASIAFLALSLSLAVAAVAPRQESDDEPPCVYDECSLLVDASACYNSAVSRRNKEALFQCVEGGEEYVCNCWGCDTSLINFVRSSDDVCTAKPEVPAVPTSALPTTATPITAIPTTAVPTPV